MEKYEVLLGYFLLIVAVILVIYLIVTVVDFIATPGNVRSVLIHWWYGT